MTTDLGPHRPGHTTTQPCPPNPRPSRIHNQSSKRQDPSSWKQPLRSIVQVSVSNQNHPEFWSPHRMPIALENKHRFAYHIFNLCCYPPPDWEAATYPPGCGPSQPANTPNRKPQWIWLSPCIAKHPGQEHNILASSDQCYFLHYLRKPSSSLPHGVERKL